MSESRERMRDLFDRARRLPRGERAAFLSGLAGLDGAMRAQVEDMLAALDDAGPFLSEPTQAMGASASPTADSGLAGATTVAQVREGPGLRIGPYKILQLIGEGGFGSVFMAEQEKPVSRRVALKIIKLGMDTRQVVARFEQERQALAMMDHPNIAKVLDAGATETGRPFFVMELVKGDPIVEYCDKNNLTIRDRLELFSQVCAAVQHAHTKGIIHRDIKPSNVLVNTQDGRPHARVIDFGIAKATASKLTEKTLFTEHRQLIGTPEYMSPEQAEGNLDIDTRTDVYSLGVLLYELLTGTTPFESKQLRSAAYAEIQRIIREVEPPKPSTRLSSNTDTIASVAANRKSEPGRLRSLVRGELDWIVMKAMEKDRQRRYETANGLAVDVLRYLAGEAVVAAPPSAAYRFKKFMLRHRLVVAAGSAVAAALLIGVVAFAWQAKLARAQRDIAVNAQAAEAEQHRQAEAARAEALAQKARAEEKELEARTQEAEAKRQEAEARKQEAEASRQATIAKAVAKFQAEMISAVDPYEMRRDSQTGELLKDNVTVLQVIRSAVKSLDDGDQKDHPEVEAGVRHMIGITLRSLGRYEESERVFRRALEIRRATLPAKDESIAASLDNLASTLFELNKLDEAESMYREALEIRRGNLPPRDPSLAISINNLATHIQKQNKPEEAEKLFREAIAIQRSAPEAERPNLAISLDNLGKLLALRNNLEEGESLLREALRIRLQVFPADHPQVALGKANLAGALGARRKYPEAETLLRESLAIRRAVLPAKHPDIAASLSALGGILRREEKLAEAEPVLREALEMDRASLPAGHSQIATDLNNMGLVLKDLGKLDEAEPFYRESLAVRRAALPAGHPELATALNNLAVLLKDQGKLEEAEPLYREAVQIRRDGLPPGHPLMATSLSNLGGLLLAQNKLEEAEGAFQEALEIRRRAFAADHPDVAKSLAWLADVEEKLGKAVPARAVRDEVIAIMRKASPEGSASLARALWRSAGLYLKENNAKAALPELEEAVTMAEKFLKPDDKQLKEYRATLEECRQAIDK